MATQDDTPAIEDMLKAVNEAAGTARTVFVSLMLLGLYFLIVAAGTDDLALLRNATVAVPTLSNATLPARAFFVFAPLVFLFLHLDLLIHFKLLSDKVGRLNELLDDAGRKGRSLARDQRLRLASFPFASWLGGERGGARLARWLQAASVWLTLVLIPLLVLLALQLGFLAYQSTRITWLHRATLIVDAGLLLYYWPLLARNRKGQTKRCPSTGSGLRRWPAVLGRIGSVGAVAVPSFLALVVGLTVATIPDEMADGWSRILYGELDASDLDDQFLSTAWRSCQHVESPESRSDRCRDVEQSALFLDLSAATHCADLIVALLPGVPLPGSQVAGSGAAPQSSLARFLENASRLPVGMKASCPTIAFFHIKGSALRRTLLVENQVLADSPVRPELALALRRNLRAWQDCVANPRPTLDGCESRLWADHEDQLAQINGLDLSERQLRWARLAGIGLPGARLDRAQLDHANLAGADLRRVDAASSTLVRADLSGAVLAEAKLGSARLAGANLDQADLSGAMLAGATLQRALLRGSNLVGADLRKARLDDAQLHQARLAGADLSSARLAAADLRASSLVGANLSQAGLVGADLSDSDLRAARLTDASLLGATLAGAKLSAAILTRPSAAALTDWPAPADSRQWVVLRDKLAYLSAAGGDGPDEAMSQLNALYPPQVPGAKFYFEPPAIVANARERLRRVGQSQMPSFPDCLGEPDICGPVPQVIARARQRAHFIESTLCADDGDVRYGLTQQLIVESLGHLSVRIVMPGERQPAWDEALATEALASLKRITADPRCPLPAAQKAMIARRLRRG